MIKMKALRSFTGASEKHVKRGREFVAHDERRAKELEVHGLAFRIEGKAEPPLQNKMEPPPQNKAAELGPFDLAGGRIGEDNAPSSSPPDHQRRRRRSTRSRAEPESSQ